MVILHVLQYQRNLNLWHKTLPWTIMALFASFGMLLQQMEAVQYLTTKSAIKFGMEKNTQS